MFSRLKQSWGGFEMAKNKKSRAKYLEPAVAPKPNFPPLMLGGFAVPEFDGLSSAFGARLDQYPSREAIPKVDRKFTDVVDALFFRGGTLAQYGLKLKSGLDHQAAMTAIRSWLCSFDPKHEHKTETVAWALAEWCEPI